MSLVWQFVLAGVGTYLIRVSAIAVMARGGGVPARVERTLRLIAPAVLAAIIANGLLLDGTRLNTRPSWYVGTITAVVVARRSHSAAWAMAWALAVVWVLQQAGVR